MDISGLSDKVSEIIKEGAGKIVKPRFQNLHDHEVTTKKSRTDLLTIADTEMEHFLERNLPQLLPGSRFIGEESTSRGEFDLKALENEDDYFWVVDPIDGTFNFANGIAEFGVMVAVMKQGRPVAGWIYDVPGDRLYTGFKGEGAYIEGKPVRLDVSEKSEKQMSGVIGNHALSHGFLSELKLFSDKFERIIINRCSAASYAGLVNGALDFVIYRVVYPWDHMPGSLIFKEAGGNTYYWDGNEYIYQKEKMGIFSASTQALADDIQSNIRQICEKHQLLLA